MHRCTSLHFPPISMDSHGPGTVPPLSHSRSLAQDTVVHERCLSPRMSTPSPLAPILLIDDNREDLFLTQRLLVKAGARNRIVAVDDGEAGIAFLRSCMVPKSPQEMPILVLCDVRMPRVDGFEVLEWVRDQPMLKSLYFAMHTGGAVPADRERALKSGANEFLVKFPTVVELQKMMKSAL